VPQPEDRSPALEARLLDSLWRNRLWQYTLGWMPARPPATLEEAVAIMWMPRQVGGDPPIPFVAAALPLRLLAGRSIDTQARLLRLLNALALPLIALCAYGAARELDGDRPSAIPLAATALLALHPMLASISGAVGNDPLANLCGAATCWAFLHAMRRGLTPRRALLAAAPLALGLLSKRTLLPFALVLGAAGAIWLARRTWRAPARVVLVRQRRAGGA
jgi:4-amino-4-deoxy-L-arabinose transferase-like glycosyltransferase